MQTHFSTINEEILEKARQQKLNRLAANAERIRQKYGDWLTDFEVLQICDAEEENLKCAECQGLPCMKSRNQNFRQVIQPNDEAQILYMASSPCKYIRAQWEQNRLKELFKTAGIPTKYLGLTFEDYTVDANNQQAVKAAKKLIERNDKGAFFYGRFGTGKTMLAAIIAQEHLRRGRAVLFCKLPDLLVSIRATYVVSKPQAVSEAEILKKIYEVPVLILDDVKAVRQKRFAGETLFNIIDARDNEKLQTIMTSNNTLAELKDALDNPLEGGTTYDGSRIYDRCKQMCFPYFLGGESRR